MNLVENDMIVSMSETSVCMEKGVSSLSRHMHRMLSNMRRTWVIVYGGTVLSDMRRRRGWFAQGRIFSTMITPATQRSVNPFALNTRWAKLGKILHGVRTVNACQRYGRRADHSTSSVESVLAVHNAYRVCGCACNVAHRALHITNGNVSRWASFYKHCAVRGLFWDRVRGCVVPT